MISSNKQLAKTDMNWQEKRGSIYDISSVYFWYHQKSCLSFSNLTTVTPYFELPLRKSPQKG